MLEWLAESVIFCGVSQQWILDPDDLMRERHEDLAVLSQDEYQKIIIFFANCKFYILIMLFELLALSRGALVAKNRRSILLALSTICLARSREI